MESLVRYRPIQLASLIAIMMVTWLLAWDVSDVQAQDSDRFVVAVLPFTSPEEGKAKDLEEKIIAGMDLLGPYTMVEQDAINEALKADGLEPGTPIPDAKSLEIARGLEAKIVGRGTLEKSGDDWTATATFVDVATRNTQQLPAVSGRDIDGLAEGVVAAFNARNQADKHIIFGRDYERSENYPRAISNFNKALEYDPDLAAAYYYLGNTYLKVDSLDQALTSLEKAVDLDPAYINAYHSIGSAYLEKGDTLQARQFFDELVQRKGDSCDIQVAYGYVMANQLGETEKGIEAFEKAKSLCPGNRLAYQYEAYALPLDRWEEKIENLTKYLELSEGMATDIEALRYLFGIYFTAELYQEAKDTVDRVLVADPENSDLQLAAGAVRERLEEYEEAIEFYNKSIEINPNNENAYLLRALAYKEVGNMTAYANDLERAGRGQSTEIMANIFLRDAAESIKQGRATNALQSLNRAAQLGGDGCAIEYYRGDAYYRMGKALQGEEKTIKQNESARELFQRAIRHLGNACGDYGQYADGLINNSNQYIERVDLIIKKLSRGR